MDFVSKNVVKSVEICDGKITSCRLVNRITGREMNAETCEFAIAYIVKQGLLRKKAVIDSSQATVTNTTDTSIAFAANHGGYDWSITINYTPDDISGALKKTITLRVSSPNVVIEYIQLDAFKVPANTFNWTVPKVTKRVFIPAYITTMGQPYYVSDMFFGGEFPTADNRIEDGFAYCRYYTERSFQELAPGGEYESVPFVIGSGHEDNFHRMRADFFTYISSISAQPVKFRIQFNSWYDNMLNIDSRKISESFRAVAKGLGNAGLRPLDCYVVDDGWTDYTQAKFWTFDYNKFPQEFNAESALTKDLDSTFGVWFGPRGGYTRQTVKYAKLLESIGYPSCRQSHDICTANPAYIRNLCKRMADFCEKFNVSYFKIDGFAITPCKSSSHGHPRGKGDGLGFYTFLWEEWTKGFERIRRARKDVFLNVTSYAHCSPWFLKWCDAIWLNNCGDMGYAGTGDNLSQCLNYRDGRYRDFFEERQLQFPVSNLYNHEPCYAERNCNPPMTSNLQHPDKLHPTVTYDYSQFKDYLYMCMMRGTGFVELYFTPAMFDDQRWKIAADVLKWAEENFDILKNSRFFGDSPEKGNVYGYYAYNDGKGILAIRNSSNHSAVYSFDNRKLCFDTRNYEISEFNSQSENTTRIDADTTFDINLRPYEIKMFNVKSSDK